MTQRFGVGEVFGKSFQLLLANLIPFFVITTLVQVPLIAYGIYYALGFRSLVTLEEINRHAQSGVLIITALSLFLGPIATGAMTFGAIQYLRGSTASVGECISVGISRLLPVLGVAICSGVLILLGIVLLIIPGIIALCMFYVAVPAAVIERVGVTQALTRSSELTRGSRWKIFGIVFILGIIEKVSGKALEVGLLTDVNSILPYMVAVLALGIFIGAWQASAAAVSYYYLRSTKESVDIEEIAAVFD